MGENSMLYTMQLSQWSKLPKEIELIDITVKSSREPWSIFAPDWDLVDRYKGGELSDDEYTKEYYELMRVRYHTHASVFKDIINKAKQRDIAIGCYCAGFCHRYLLKDILQRIDKELKYGGEYRLQEQLSLF